MDDMTALIWPAGKAVGCEIIKGLNRTCLRGWLPSWGVCKESDSASFLGQVRWDVIWGNGVRIWRSMKRGAITRGGRSPIERFILQPETRVPSESL